MPICSRSRESQPLLDVQPYSLGAPDACDVGHRLEKNLGIPGSCTTVLPRLITEVANNDSPSILLDGKSGPDWLPILTSCRSTAHYCAIDAGLIDAESTGGAQIRGAKLACS
jgi:hypothetical protein